MNTQEIQLRFIPGSFHLFTMTLDDTLFMPHRPRLCQTALLFVGIVAAHDDDDNDIMAESIFFKNVLQLTVLSANYP